MKTEQQTFAQKLRLFEYKVDLRTAFDDFLTMTIFSFGQNPGTGKAYDEALYVETISKYKDDALRFEFPKLLACLITEMTNRLDSSSGWDVLGEFYETNLQGKGLSQFFTPWPICVFMAKSICEARQETNAERPLLILDPCCGSGRMLLASSRECGPYQEYYGIDVDHTCVKMTSLNLFLSGLFRTETMWGDALARDDFKTSYTTSFLPFGLFRVKEKEHSKLWHLMQNTLNNMSKHTSDALSPNPTTTKDGSQLTIF